MERFQGVQTDSAPVTVRYGDDSNQDESADRVSVTGIVVVPPGRNVVAQARNPSAIVQIPSLHVPGGRIAVRTNCWRVHRVWYPRHACSSLTLVSSNAIVSPRSTSDSVAATRSCGWVYEMASFPCSVSGFESGTTSSATAEQPANGRRD